MRQSAARSGPVMPLTWEVIVKLATKVDASYAQHVADDKNQDCIRLARLILEFQHDVLHGQPGREPRKK